MATRGDLNHRFDYHPPRSSQRVADHEHVRSWCRTVAGFMNEALPDGREKAVVLTKIEEAMFWANAALARGYDPDAEVSVAEAAAGPRHDEEDDDGAVKDKLFEQIQRAHREHGGGKQ